MSKSKSKSKSKQATFPEQYWRPDFEIYTHYPNLFDHGKELLAVAVKKPPQDGNAVAEEVGALLDKQKHLNGHFDERERRREEIEWEADHLSRSYQAALLTDTYSKTWQLMHTMDALALVPVMHFKKRFMRARPNQIEPGIEPLIGVPGHPSYPSGHATQNFLIAHLLSEIIGDDAELIARVFAIARRVAENREYAGLHYASDTKAGEDLARDIFPTMRRAFAEPIEKAIEEWQELELEPPAGLTPAARLSGDPFPGTHFQQHQWNLQNVGQTGGKRGVDINVLGAWRQLEVWQGGGGTVQEVRVALIDLAIDFEHPALAERLDYDGARNLDYPNVPKRLSDGTAAEFGLTDQCSRKVYFEAFGSRSSAHAVACAGIIAADKQELVQEADSAPEEAREPGSLGIAPHARIVPFRAMTLTEPILHKRQLLARAVLEAATGHAFVESEQLGHHGPTTRWKLADEQGRPAHVLLFPLPLEPLLEPHRDPLPLALAFAATRISVIIPSGNKGTSSLSYPLGCDPTVQNAKSIQDLAELFDLDSASTHAVFGTTDRSDLIAGMGTDASIISVGACNDEGRRSRYSQYGSGLTLVAPSDDVLPLPRDVENGARRPPSIATTDLKGIGGYMQNQSHYTLSDNEFGFGGTSAAGAQVAGVIALMLQANPRLKPGEVHEILCGTAQVSNLELDDGTTPSGPSEEFGHGLVDAARAVEEAQRRNPAGRSSTDYANSSGIKSLLSFVSWLILQAPAGRIRALFES